MRAKKQFMSGKLQSRPKKLKILEMLRKMGIKFRQNYKDRGGESLQRRGEQQWGLGEDIFTETSIHYLPASP